ncbi:unnamed protein product [Discosporangium mesarthrocarpum]
MALWLYWTWERRAGDVIPQVLGLASSRTEETGDMEDSESASLPSLPEVKNPKTAFVFPTECPACGTKVVKEEDKAVTRCPAGLSCPAQAVEHLKHFVSRGAFDIQGLGPARLRELFTAKIVQTPVDILQLKERTRKQSQETPQETLQRGGEGDDGAVKAISQPEQQMVILRESLHQSDHVPGVHFPAHVHQGNEVRHGLEGSLNIDGQVYVEEDNSNGMDTEGGDPSHPDTATAKAEEKKTQVDNEDYSSLLEDCEGWGYKSTRNIFEAIDKARDITLGRFICALGIRHVGGTMANLIADNFNADFDAWWGALTRAAEASDEEDVKASLEAFKPIQGMGPAVLTSLVQFVKAPANRSVVEALAKEVRFVKQPNGNRVDLDALVVKHAGDGKEMPGSASTTTIGAPWAWMAGKTVVFTGSLTRMKRAEVQAAARDMGAKVTGSISGRTDVVVVGMNPGGKLEQAQAVGVAEILSEEEWYRRTGLLYLDKKK